MGSLAFSGAVLAGGRSSRMGTDKSRLRLGGETLLARQLRLLAEAGAQERIVAGGVGGWELEPGIRVVADRKTGLGPLAGLEACLSVCTHEWLLVLAVDLPGMSAEFLRRLLESVAPGCGVVPWRDGFAEPLAAVYPRIALAEVTARLARRELALQPLVRTGLEAGWLRSLPVGPADAALFANWNRPEDVAGAGGFGL
jgi:molybdopterin-guanine dinucleotide biosynthesis protein A